MQPSEISVRYRPLESCQLAWELNPADWLTEAERREGSLYRDPARFRQFLAGRWLAKQILTEDQAELSLDWREVEILSRDEARKAICPTVRIGGTATPWSISISHSSTGVLAAAASTPGLRVGVDLTEWKDIRPQSLRFWFSETERNQLRLGDLRQLATYWAIKEAMYKAVNTGESFAPGKFEIRQQDPVIYDCLYEGASLLERSRLTVREVENQIAVIALVADSSRTLREVPRGTEFLLCDVPVAD